MSHPESVADLVARAQAGDARALGRLLSFVESGERQVRDVMAALGGYAGGAHVVGFTGSPGVGKSTITSAVVRELRRAGRRVGVLAIDPSSPFSGGALLGDRIRMQTHATDSDVFIRSMAARGHLGGLSAATPQAVRLLDAAGYDPILIETVGVGQSEIDVAAQADTTVVVTAPGMGDAIQAAKAGILEVADILVVNQADRDGAPATARELRHMVAMSPATDGGWEVPVLQTTALTGEGVDKLVADMEARRAWLEASGVAGERRRERARGEILHLALASVRSQVTEGVGREVLDSLSVEVAAGGVDAFAAADRLVAAMAGR